GAISILCFSLILLFFADKGFGAENAELTRFYAFDPLARFFKLFTIIATILTLLLALDHRKILSKFTANPDSEDGTGEYYCLFLFACAGMMWMASAKDLVSLFVALELTTITSYILVGYMRRNVGSLEAGVKFLILGALSTGFLVYGIAWIYGATGTTDLALIGERITEQNSTYLLFGLALILVSLAFKVGAVPMHLWIPDVYQGAPTPTTAFLSIASKASGFAIAIRVTEPFLNSGTDIAAKTTFILATLAGATILLGNLAAIPQKNFKRLLAYSSIANAGFILLPMAAWQTTTDELTSKQVIAFYLTIYLIMTFAAFFILAIIHRNTGSDEISAFEGLGRRHPLLAIMTAIIIGALAGLPLTAGFWESSSLLKPQLMLDFGFQSHSDSLELRQDFIIISKLYGPCTGEAHWNLNPSKLGQSPSAQLPD
ncbi:MAG: NADH-quinone oxidoreductase subunit N, partial [Akkermansiaceae bacterium]